MRICDCFLKSFTGKEVSERDFKMAKKQLYDFFDQYTEIVAKDFTVYKLIYRILTVLAEPFEVKKEFKLKEIKAIQYQPNWDKDL